MRTLALREYLRELSDQRGAAYTYGVRSPLATRPPGAADAPAYWPRLAIYRGSAEAFEGPMEHVRGDVYAVTFPRAGVRVSVYWFM